MSLIQVRLLNVRSWPYPNRRFRNWIYYRSEQRFGWDFWDLALNLRPIGSCLIHNFGGFGRHTKMEEEKSCTEGDVHHQDDHSRVPCLCHTGFQATTEHITHHRHHTPHRTSSSRSTLNHGRDNLHHRHHQHMQQLHHPHHHHHHHELHSSSSISSSVLLTSSEGVSSFQFFISLCSLFDYVYSWSYNLCVKYKIRHLVRLIITFRSLLK